MSPKNTDKTPPAEPKSFEEALARLEALVSEMETGEIPLEKSLLSFEEGQQLISYCEKKLKAAEAALKQIAYDARDALSESPDSSQH
jgi:exodeoxyribonuclease VII small subunit